MRQDISRFRLESRFVLVTELFILVQGLTGDFFNRYFSTVFVGDHDP